jgi:D-alanine-D-alanine ligase
MPRATSAFSSPCTGAAARTARLQGALDLLAIPYTGSGVLASALAMDKWRSKLVWQASGLPVPDYMVLDGASDFAAVEARLGLPLFVKPANEGSSIGISKVKQAGWPEARPIELASRYDPCVIAEQPISAAASLPSASLAGEALPVIRIVPATEFYDYEAKYLRDDTEYRIPSGLGDQREREMRDLALRAFAVLGGRGWGRMDLMLDAAGPHVSAWKRIPRPA